MFNTRHPCLVFDWQRSSVPFIILFYYNFLSSVLFCNLQTNLSSLIFSILMKGNPETRIQTWQERAAAWDSAPASLLYSPPVMLTFLVDPWAPTQECGMCLLNSSRFFTEFPPLCEIRCLNHKNINWEFKRTSINEPLSEI